jgi:hypothetical protein
VDIKKRKFRNKEVSPETMYHIENRRVTKNPIGISNRVLGLNE